MKNQTLAAILSFIIPGVGQLYNGDILRGLGWLILAGIFDVTLVVFTGGLGGPAALIIHGLCCYTAYKRANEINAAMGGFF